MAKTIVDVDDTLMQRAMRLSGNATKKATVNDALQQLVRRHEAKAYIEDLTAGLAADLDDPEVVRGAQR